MRVDHVVRSQRRARQARGHRGRWAGRALVSPGSRIRPTAEDVRARWLDLLAESLQGARVLDLFAYTGGFAVAAALGGASAVTLVESSSTGLALARENLASNAADLDTEIVQGDAFRFLRGAGDPFDLIVLDEITYLPLYDFIGVEEIVAAVTEKPESLSIIMTGRNAAQELVDVCDTVSEIQEIKHAYQSGIKAQKGVDW